MPILTIREVCNINHWGIGYYDVDDSGEIIVRPNPRNTIKLFHCKN